MMQPLKKLHLCPFNNHIHFMDALFQASATVKYLLNYLFQAKTLEYLN